LVRGTAIKGEGEEEGEDKTEQCRIVQDRTDKSKIERDRTRKDRIGEAETG
jgi:hypothetical protein